MKFNLKNIKWNLAAGEKRDVFNILTKERNYTSHPQTGKICELMKETLSLSLLHKSCTRNPSPAWDTNLDWMLCSEDRGFLHKKLRLGRHSLLQRRIHSVFSFSEHFSYFLICFPLDLKWIIQSVSLIHIRLHQFDFVWCRGEGKWHALYLEHYLSLQECGEIKPQKGPL